MHPLLLPSRALLLCSLAAATAASDVINLTALSFGTIVGTEPLILVRFCIPCFHCKALTPQYEEAATFLKTKNIKIADIDCLDDLEFCKRHEVRGYPTLKVFRYGSSVNNYYGLHQADAIVNYMLEKSLPPVSEVTGMNHEEFQQRVANSKKVAVIAYLTSSAEATAVAFHTVAEKCRDRNYIFGLSTDKHAIAAAGVTPPAVVAYRSFDDPRLQYPLPASGISAAELGKWLSDISIPLVDELSVENYAKYAKRAKPLAHLFLRRSDPKTEGHINDLESIARKYRAKVNFVWVDAFLFRDEARRLYLKDSKWPAFVIQDFPRQQWKYPLDQSTDITPESVEDWVQQFLSGELDPVPKSAPIPKIQDGPVYTLVGKQFDEIVFDDSKDVFIEFYTTKCRDCERMKPAWDSLAEKYAPLKDKITIAKMEMKENDLPDSAPFWVSGFPTIKFKPARTRLFVDYNRYHTLEGFVGFVEEYAANSPEIPIPKVDPVVPEEVEVAQIPLGAMPHTSSAT
ncbi:protein disulfide-isomerase precursor [Pleurotus pulmonarius]|nr:protein disulfide-isomerase precursor [Pleurotus pulmonarius]KAF4580651.1 protein disulfide-isomerase precursor [Pleurotus pulmonarius]